MTEGFALEYIRRRMDELGVDNHYHLRYRHIRLGPKGRIELDGFNQYYYLIQPATALIVGSMMGCYDRTSAAADELVYEHRGQIILHNSSGQPLYARLIQVIPFQHSKSDRTC